MLRQIHIWTYHFCYTTQPSFHGINSQDAAPIAAHVKLYAFPICCHSMGLPVFSILYQMQEEQVSSRIRFTVVF